MDRDRGRSTDELSTTVALRLYRIFCYLGFCIAIWAIWLASLANPFFRRQLPRGSINGTAKRTVGAGTYPRVSRDRRFRGRAQCGFGAKGSDEVEAKFRVQVSAVVQPTWEVGPTGYATGSAQRVAIAEMSAKTAGSPNSRTSVGHLRDDGENRFVSSP